MEYTYEIKETTEPALKYIQRSDNARIPIEPANSDYQEYLKSLEEN
jgi:hypothetical protein